MRFSVLLLWVGAASLSAGVSAAQTVSTASGDLILGFRVYAPAQGAGTNLEVNLGPIDGYLHTSGFQLVGRLSPLDLSNTYGSDWFTRADLAFGVVGVAGPATSPTVYASVAGDSEYVRSVFELLYPVVEPVPVAPETFSTNTLKVARSSILSLTSQSDGVDGSLDGATSTSNSPYTALISESGHSSWSSVEDQTANVSFSIFNTGTFERTGNATATSLYLESELFMYTNNSATYLGSFVLDAGGNLLWAVPVPEPATYGLLLGAGGIAVALIRRRRRARA